MNYKKYHLPLVLVALTITTIAPTNLHGVPQGKQKRSTTGTSYQEEQIIVGLNETKKTILQPAAKNPWLHKTMTVQKLTGTIGVAVYLLGHNGRQQLIVSNYEQEKTESKKISIPDQTEALKAAVAAFAKKNPTKHRALIVTVPGTFTESPNKTVLEPEHSSCFLHIRALEQAAGMEYFSSTTIPFGARNKLTTDDLSVTITQNGLQWRSVTAPRSLCATLQGYHCADTPQQSFSVEQDDYNTLAVVTIKK